MQLVIRRYRGPSDGDAARALFSHGILEHINPCFYNAMTSPVHLAVSLGFCSAGYLFLGSAWWALLLAGGWAGFVYYCCHELYAGYVRSRLRADMRDIPASYLARPDDCFWVAEAEVDDGRPPRLVGIVAVVAKRSGPDVYGELFRMIISPCCRRTGLGSRMAQTVVDFCKERGFARVELETSSTQSSAVALYKKMGFDHVLSHTTVHVPGWMVKVTGVTILKMEKRLQD